MIQPHPDVLAAVPATFIDFSRAYPGVLPRQIAQWHVYLWEHGHCLMVMSAAHYRPEHPPADQLVPVPVRSALQGELFAAPTGHLMMEIEYDPQRGGVVFNEEDIER